MVAVRSGRGVFVEMPGVVSEESRTEFGSGVSVVSCGEGDVPIGTPCSAAGRACTRILPLEVFNNPVCVTVTTRGDVECHDVSPHAVEW